MSRRVVLPWLVAALASACSTGTEGTIELSVATAPGSDVMDGVVTARLTLSDPPTVVEAGRDAGGGFSLALDVEAGNTTGTIALEGLDASGDLVAYGRTAPLPIAAIDAAITIYVARPMSLAEAPVALDPARSDMGAAAVPFGAALAGGRGPDGTASAQVAIYNVYAHALQPVQDLPAARVAPTLMAGAQGILYVFGGDDRQGAASADAWRLDVSVPPAGFYSDMRTDPDLARAGARAAPLAGERFAITGAPLARLDGLDNQVSAYPDGPAVQGTATSVILDDVIHTLFAGAGSGTSGALLLVDGELVDIAAPAGMARTGHGAVVLADDTLLVLGGQVAGPDGGELVASGVRVDVGAREAWVEEALLATPRRDAAVAATDQYVIAAGGVDAEGALIADAEVLDAATLERVATLPMGVPRRDALALPLASGQVLIAGGADAAGQPVGVLELFTPGPL